MSSLEYILLILVAILLVMMLDSLLKSTIETSTYTISERVNPDKRVNLFEMYNSQLEYKNATLVNPDHIINNGDEYHETNITIKGYTKNKLTENDMFYINIYNDGKCKWFIKNVEYNGIPINGSNYKLTWVTKLGNIYTFNSDHTIKLTIILDSSGVCNEKQDKIEMFVGVTSQYYTFGNDEIPVTLIITPKQ